LEEFMLASPADRTRHGREDVPVPADLDGWNRLAGWTESNNGGAMDAAQLVEAHFEAVARGDSQLAARCLTFEHVNHMAVGEPPACSLPGVPGFMATSAWLRLAFPDLPFE